MHGFVQISVVNKPGGGPASRIVHQTLVFCTLPRAQRARLSDLRGGRMKPTACLLLGALLAMSGLAARAGDNTPSATKPQTERNSSMSEQPMMSDLFDRWERVWHEGQYDLVPSCVAEHYIRHDEGGDRTVTREAYAAEIAKTRQERPDIRVVVYDHSFEGDRAWFRFAFKWTDPNTGEPRSRAGMQSYRIEAGKLAETWLVLQPLGSAWSDAVAQEHWTSQPPIK
jgi:SnoaL-like polyketide cyclase